MNRFTTAIIASRFVAPIFIASIFISSIFIAPILVSSAAFAQSSPAPETPAQSSPAENPPAPPIPAPAALVAFSKVQVFAGYSLLHEGIGNLNSTNFDVDLRIFPNTLVPRTNLNGWNAEAQYNFGPWVGGVLDFSGFYGFPFSLGVNGMGVSGLPSASSYSVMAGPVISYPHLKRFTPYAHALFGWNRANLGASTLTGTSYPVSSAGTTYNDFVMAFGVGLDYKVTRRFGLRLGQLDWFHTSLNLNSFYGSAFGPGLFQGFETHERNVRISTGLVLKF